MNKYNHAFDIAFGLENTNEDGDATEEELFAEDLGRLEGLEK